MKKKTILGGLALFSLLYSVAALLYFFFDHSSRRLIESIRKGDTGSVSWILSFQDPPLDEEYKGMTPLIAAVCYRRIDVLMRLLAAGADPNKQSKTLEGATPLMCAIIQNDNPSSMLLLRCDANPNIKNAAGITALSLACEVGDAYIVEQLLQYGADPNAREPDGTTPLLRAIRKGSAEKVGLLLDYEADPATVDGHGIPVVFHACGKGIPLKVFATLVEHGAPLSHKGALLIGWAQETERKDIVDFLLDYYPKKGEGVEHPEKRRDNAWKIRFNRK